MTSGEQESPVELELHIARTPSFSSRLRISPAAQKWILGAAIALYVAARLWRPATICLDGDEIFSLGVARNGWRDLITVAAADSVHPPLFYCLLKLWMRIGGDALLWLRLLPALFSIAAVVPAVLLCRSLRLTRIATSCVIGLAALNPHLIYYSQHDRMYSLLLLCGISSLWLFHRAITAESGPAARRFAILTLVNIALVYSHYYGWLLVGLEFCYLLLRRRKYWKLAVVSIGAVLAAFGPWLYIAVKFAYSKGGLSSNLDWIKKPGLADLRWFFVDILGFSESPYIGGYVLWFVLICIAAAWFAAMRRPATSFGRSIHFLILFTLAPPAIAFAASRILPDSVWGHRHLIFVAVLLLILCTAACFYLRSRIVAVLGALACAAWAAIVVPYDLRGTDLRRPTDWLVVQMLEREGSDTGPTRLYSIDKYLHYGVGFYLETLRAKHTTGMAVRLSPDELAALSTKAARVEVISDAKIDAVSGTHFWILYSNPPHRDTLPQAIMAQRGCRTGPEIAIRDRYRQSIAFPVWCDTPKVSDSP